MVPTPTPTPTDSADADLNPIAANTYATIRRTDNVYAVWRNMGDERGWHSEHQRRALLAHRTQIPSESFLVSLPPELRRLAFATAYFVRLSPPCTLGEHELDLLDRLD